MTQTLVLLFVVLFFSITVCSQEQSKIPPKLKAGDEIRIVAPSGFLTSANRDQLQKSLEMLASWKLKITIGENLFNNSTSVGGFAGKDSQRISDFNKAIEDDHVKAIFCARGGYGAPRIVKQFNFEKLKKNPKWILGYSDVTMILLYLEGHSIVGGVHSSMPASSGFNQMLNSKSIQNILFHHKLMNLIGEPHPKNRIGKAKGKIIAGNVSLMISSLGSIGEIQTDGKILLIEEIGENLYSCKKNFFFNHNDFV